MMDAGHVRRVAAECVGFLSAHLEEDWASPVPDVEMSVVEVVAHAAEGCLWYAIDLAAGGADLHPVEHRVKTDGEPSDVVATLGAYAEVIAAVVEASPASARGFHPMGIADSSGFAAMACDEMLIHTDDAGRGVGASFAPSPELAELVLHRLFPWVDEVGDSWERLRWANGRITLGEVERLSGWAWHCAPLTNGTERSPSGRPSLPSRASHGRSTLPESGLQLDTP